MVGEICILRWKCSYNLRWNTWDFPFTTSRNPRFEVSHKMHAIFRAIFWAGCYWQRGRKWRGKQSTSLKINDYSNISAVLLDSMIRGARYIVSINRTFFWMYPHDCELCTLQANQAESFAIFTGNIENARSSRVGTKMNLFEFLYWKLPFFAWDALEKNMKNMWLINLCLYG